MMRKWFKVEFGLLFLYVILVAIYYMLVVENWDLTTGLILMGFLFVLFYIVFILVMNIFEKHC